MAYILVSSSGVKTVYPDTFDEAIQDFLDAEIPLESGSDLSRKFFDFLTVSGFDVQVLHQMKSKRPESAINSDL